MAGLCHDMRKAFDYMAAGTVSFANEIRIMRFFQAQENAVGYLFGLADLLEDAQNQPSPMASALLWQHELALQLLLPWWSSTTSSLARPKTIASVKSLS